MKQDAARREQRSEPGLAGSCPVFGGFLAFNLPDTGTGLMHLGTRATLHTTLPATAEMPKRGMKRVSRGRLGSA